MPKFPVDAPKQKVVKSLEILGFKMIREREHISMERINTDGTKTPLTIPNHPKASPFFCGRNVSNNYEAKPLATLGRVAKAMLKYLKKRDSFLRMPIGLFR